MSKGEKVTLRSRIPVILMVLIIVAPMISAWVAFKYFPDAIRTLGTSNYGRFIDPPVKFLLDSLTDVDGKVIPADILNKNWTYVYLHSSDCGRACYDRLMLMKNVRLSQGKEISRMKRLFVITSGEINDELKEMLTNFPTMRTVLLNNEAQRNSFRKLFTTADEQDSLTAGFIYIIDPDAKLMMYYKTEDKPEAVLDGMGRDAIIKLGKGMQDDIAKLMKNSKLRK